VTRVTVGIVAWVIAACLAAGSSGANTPSKIRSDGGSPDGTTTCGEMGETCCNGTALQLQRRADVRRRSVRVGDRDGSDQHACCDAHFFFKVSSDGSLLLMRSAAIRGLTSQAWRNR
jgi:hypothetical protein